MSVPTMSAPHLDGLPETLLAPRTRPLLVLRLQVKTFHPVGLTPGVHRRVAVVSGGTFEGPQLSGTVLEGGSDWLSVRPDGATMLDVRLVLRTHEGDLIAMTYRGLRHGPPDVMKRLDAGEDVDPASYYFRIVPFFETASTTHDWLNRIVTVGLGHRRPDGPVYSVFEVL